MKALKPKKNKLEDLIFLTYLSYSADLIFFLFKKIFIRISLSSLSSSSSLITLDGDNNDDNKILMKIFLNRKKIKSTKYQRYIINIKSFRYAYVSFFFIVDQLCHAHYMFSFSYKYIYFLRSILFIYC